MCKTVYRFLREAAKKRKFQVVVAEGAPDFRGQQLARSLAEAGIMARPALNIHPALLRTLSSPRKRGGEERAPDLLRRRPCAPAADDGDP